MNFTGQRVTHILPNGKPGRYGVGTIVEFQNAGSHKRVSIKFDSEDEIKVFSYPECFWRYLKPEDPETAKYMEDIKEACMLTREKTPRPEKGDSMIQKPYEESSTQTSSILNELDSMTGLHTVKRDVRLLTSFIQVNEIRKARGLKAPEISKHLVLTGNSGTGKTTVARLIAHIYYSIGAIREDKIVETSREHLVAGYIGQTAIKTQEVINSALGGVLFIDEAYSLAEGSNDDYGMEAIDTLLRAMENNRDDLVVIVAGYAGKMKKFISSNPGLAPRFTSYIHFQDYNPDELMDILNTFCTNNDYVLQNEAEERVRKYLNDVYEHRDDEFGNARTVRNLFESIIAHQANRLISVNELDDKSLTIITDADVEHAISSAT